MDVAEWLVPMVVPSVVLNGYVAFELSLFTIIIDCIDKRPSKNFMQPYAFIITIESENSIYQSLSQKPLQYIPFYLSISVCLSLFLSFFLSFLSHWSILFFRTLVGASFRMLWQRTVHLISRWLYFLLCFRYTFSSNHWYFEQC